jgi:hypothetical protein
VLQDDVRCADCGRALGGDPDEDPTDLADPLCGECARERDFFALDLADGELDGRFDG